MKKFTVISLATLAAALIFIGCNSTSESYDYEQSANVAVRSFKLSQDDSVLKNLDTVFFSIDLDKGRIFNADSLPFGTKINKLVPRITMAAGAAAMRLTVTRPNGTDTVYDYLETPNDSIDFSNGSVMLDVTSASGTATMKYEISVNVHTVVSDTLAWGETAWAPLPSSFSAPKQQKTSRTDAGLYCLTSDGQGKYSIAFTPTPDENSWTLSDVTFPNTPFVESLTGATDALYILLDDGANQPNRPLYTSTDGGSTWTDTGRRYFNIYGGFGADVLVSYMAGDWYAAAYPSDPDGKKTPDGMPVWGTSLPVTFTAPLAMSRQAILLGGYTPDNKLSAYAWGYDGTNWMRISSQPLPAGMSGMCLVPFYVTHINDYFVATQYSVLLAFGGNDGAKNNRDVYISYYWGADWDKAKDYLQLPDFIPALDGAQAYVFDTMMGLEASDAESLWHNMEIPYRFPAGLTVLSGRPDLTAMVTKPVTTWECPFIYIFGGVTDSEELNSEIWRGTINRLRFKPIE